MSRSIGLFAIAAGTIFAVVAVHGCTAAPTAVSSSQQPASILAKSSPAAGSTVRSSVDSLELSFNPPARLLEVTVRGPDGSMPMMVHAVGETDHYSLPLSSLAPGAYTVDWKVEANGREHRGAFQFNVQD